MNSIRKFLVSLLFQIFGWLSYAVRRLLFVGKHIPIEDKIKDFFEIFKSTRLYFLFNLLAFFIFIGLPQGQDVLLVVIDDLSSGSFLSLLSLLIGLTIWSIISEFGARYKIYVTDNSGFSLSEERINYRKEAQKIVSTLYLLLPVFIVFVSIIIVSLQNIKQWELKYYWPFAVIIILLFFVFAILSKFYLDNKFIERLRNKGVWFKVSAKELKWANKLFGIYNDHVFMIRKLNNFRKDAPDFELRQAYERFIRILEALPNKSTHDEAKTIESFPRDYIKDDDLAPEEFIRVQYYPYNYDANLDDPENFRWENRADLVEQEEQDSQIVPKKKIEGFYRWIYKNNPSFYKTLHKQVHVIAISSLIIILLIAIEFPFPYYFIGSPALVCISFGCWLGIYTGLLYIDSRFKRQIKVSIRLLLFFWVLIVSYFNQDHPVRKNDYTGYSNNRPSLNVHFNDWINKHLADTNSLHSIISDTLKYYPVFFINAEGGGLRTGAFTSMLLARLQDEFAGFKDHIYAFSTVSGGSVGISYFNAISFLEPDTVTNTKNYYQNVTQKFLNNDQLSPVLGKMFYGDILNLFWPFHIENFDRAIGLEKAWEHSYGEAFNKPHDQNVYSDNFMSLYQNKLAPAWFINTTEVETGMQCYISNVKADKFLFAKERDLIEDKIHHGINYSTAVNFSSRFPLFSPAAALFQNDDRTYHYVDGGYVENTGAKTMWEILRSLQDSIQSKKVLPYVIQLEFGDSSKFKQTGFLSQLSSITSGIYNTRSGSSQIYTALLKQQVDSLNGVFIKVPLSATSKQVPMSWVFSNTSLSNLNRVIDTILKDKNNDLHKLPLPNFHQVRRIKNT